MCTIKLLLFTLISLTEGFMKPNSNGKISRSSVQSLGLSYLNSTNAACPGHCENGWAYLDETDACYKTFYWETFNNAESLCRNFGAHLTSIHSANENQFVAGLAQSGLEWPLGSGAKHATWIGLVRADDLNNKDWLWTDGTKVEFLAWAPSQPDDAGGIEHCGQLHSDPYTTAERALWYRKWNDYTCFTKVRSFVCKKMALH
ncbi:unnamed protein product [Cylicocyclus nassatus]|uniref:C-type lectin domain-containing protein n=1 Tax=Cylicocyclus nassatus TaxID=53992 RepID=A0AA36GZM4_CYLNA|nr:unnamed protein product [Cylicocyclus nassatus]